jgi:hypothetical protein
MTNSASRRPSLGLPGVLIAFAMALPLAIHAQEQRFPDVLSATVRASGANTFDFDVTVSSPYDTPTRYADAFRVLGKDGTVFGERILLHDHATEQPFTRDLISVAIPLKTLVVVVQARDKKYGYGGKSVEVTLPKR